LTKEKTSTIIHSIEGEVVFQMIRHKQNEEGLPEPIDEIIACTRCVLPECVEKNALCYLFALRKSKKELRNVHIPSNFSVPEILNYCKPLTPLETRLHAELTKTWDELTDLKDLIIAESNRVKGETPSMKQENDHEG
jgi:hypothetical protein